MLGLDLNQKSETDVNRKYWSEQKVLLNLDKYLKLQLLQRFDRRTPFAGNDLHELKAVVVELYLGSIVILGVDLTSTERATVLRLQQETNKSMRMMPQTATTSMLVRIKAHGGGGYFFTLYMLLVFFLGLASYINCMKTQRLEQK